MKVIFEDFASSPTPLEGMKSFSWFGAVTKYQSHNFGSVTSLPLPSPRRFPKRHRLTSLTLRAAPHSKGSPRNFSSKSIPRSEDHPVPPSLRGPRASSKSLTHPPVLFIPFRITSRDSSFLRSATPLFPKPPSIRRLPSLTLRAATSPQRASQEATTDNPVLVT